MNFVLSFFFVVLVLFYSARVICIAVDSQYFRQSRSAATATAYSLSIALLESVVVRYKNTTFPNKNPWQNMSCKSALVFELPLAPGLLSIPSLSRNIPSNIPRESPKLRNNYNRLSRKTEFTRDWGPRLVERAKTWDISIEEIIMRFVMCRREAWVRRNERFLGCLLFWAVCDAIMILLTSSFFFFCLLLVNWF